MNNHSLKYVSIGILAAAAFTAVIGLTAANLARFQIVGATVPFAYPWRLVQPNAIAELTAWGKRAIAIGFIVITVGIYTFMGRLSQWNEVSRIPVLDYMVIFLLYGIYLGINWIINVFKRPATLQASTD